MKLRVGFSTTNLLISKLIRQINKSSVSHTYIRFYDCFLDNFFVVHAELPDVVIVPASKFDEENTTIEEYEIEDINLKKSLIKNIKYVGRKYDFWKLIGWGWINTLRRWFKRKLKNPVEVPEKIICVDYTIRILNDADLTFFPYGVLNPEMLLKWFRENYQRFEWKRIVNDKINLFEKMEKCFFCEKYKNDWRSST